MQLLALHEEKWNQQLCMKTTMHILLIWKKDILKIYLQSFCQGEFWSNWFTRLDSDILEMKVWGEIEEHYIKELRMMYSFSFTGFLSQRIFPSKVLTWHVLWSIYIQGECYESYGLSIELLKITQLDYYWWYLHYLH